MHPRGCPRPQGAAMKLTPATIEALRHPPAFVTQVFRRQPSRSGCGDQQPRPEAVDRTVRHRRQDPVANTWSDEPAHRIAAARKSAKTILAAVRVGKGSRPPRSSRHGSGCRYIGAATSPAAPSASELAPAQPQGAHVPFAEARQAAPPTSRSRPWTGAASRSSSPGSPSTMAPQWRRPRRRHHQVSHVGLARGSDGWRRRCERHSRPGRFPSAVAHQHANRRDPRNRGRSP